MEFSDIDFPQNDSLLSSILNFTEAYEASPDVSSSAILMYASLLLICIIALMGNTLVLWVVFRYAKMKTVPNIYILNMAVMDLLNALVLPFEVTHNVLQAWPFGLAFCKLIWVLLHHPFPSACFLTVLSIDCCGFVYCPMISSKWRKAWVVKSICGTVWVFAILLRLPAILYADVKTHFPICTLYFPEGIWLYFYDLYDLIVGIFAPLLAIGLCFFLIAIKVASSGRPVGSPRDGSSEGSRKALSLTVVFLICWAPIKILLITSYFVPLIADWLFSFLYVLATAKICVNPIVCGHLFKDFNESFQTILCFWRKSDVEINELHENKEENSRQQESMLA